MRAASCLALGVSLAVIAAAADPVAAPAPGTAAAGAAPMLGFTAEHAAAQRALEARLDAALDGKQIEGWMRQLSARPHHVGSPGGRANTDLIAALFREWGYETTVERYDVLFPTPKERVLELVEPSHFVAALEEEAVPGDSTFGPREEQLPPYNAYSIDGDVTGELVYVNYGLPADYDDLARRGIDVAGKIVIARYGASWRGIKPKVAAEHGAIGCIIYSDPAEDGYVHGDPYPKGPWRPAHGVQRGSVADIPLYAGDPLTPGVAAVPGAKRLERSQAKTLTRIPVLPISAGDAQPLLAALAGPVAPEKWRGALPQPYRLGPGPAKVHLRVAFDWQLHPVFNVVGKLRGRELPDHWVMRGNQHDAWVNGAYDSVSSEAPMLAEARAIAMLAKSGWRPRRTIVYATWDGEEPGLLGSTEHVELHRAELERKLVAYLNTDANARGFVWAGGSHALEPMFNEAVRDIKDPLTGKTVMERTRAAIKVFGWTPEAEAAAESGADLPLDPLGSGSDFTPFLQHLGVATLYFGFGGEEEFGQYHSSYDTFDHYRRFVDPDLAYGVPLAQVGGRLTMRLAEADLLPFDFQRLAKTVAGYVEEVKKLAATMREETAKENGRIRDGIYAAACDPKKTCVAPQPKEPVPFLAFAPLDNAAAALQEAGARHSRAVLAKQGQALPPAATAAYDAAVIAVEHALTRPQGLPGRPWYTHEVYAPGAYTGYAVKTLPAVREAIEQRKWAEADAQIAVVAEVLRGAAAAFDRATAVLEAR
ncbi:MAG TPA: transferrin receptor-like dimerization domain-containing protein [Thermoanaerobaculia bacterium]|nr:transferrin receptor-like dimerization domain-containing protein [Thermoanaerobaculia bacterium]